VEDAAVFGNVGKCVAIVGRAVYNHSILALQDRDACKRDDGYGVNREEEWEEAGDIVILVTIEVKYY
jgi:hypothetical protein